jgi:lantibiotic biosynthesis protein
VQCAGIASILIRAGRALEDPVLAASGLDVLRATASRPIDETGIVDAWVCHGGAGLAHLYNRIAHETGDEALSAAARRWYRWILDQRRPGEGIAGFRYFHEVTREWGPLTSLRGGAAGTALVLAAGLSSTVPGVGFAPAAVLT